MAKDNDKNILGQRLAPHSGTITTSFYPDSHCGTYAHDRGQHAMATTVTKEFLEFTKLCGNDLQTPRPEYRYQGLNPGNNWCLCTTRWKKAEEAGVVSPINLEATHAAALSTVPLEILKKHQKGLSKEFS